MDGEPLMDSDRTGEVSSALAAYSGLADVAALPMPELSGLLPQREGGRSAT